MWRKLADRQRRARDLSVPLAGVRRGLHLRRTYVPARPCAVPASSTFLPRLFRGGSTRCPTLNHGSVWTLDGWNPRPLLRGTLAARAPWHTTAPRLTSSELNGSLVVPWGLGPRRRLSNLACVHSVSQCCLPRSMDHLQKGNWAPHLSWGPWPAGSSPRLPWASMLGSGRGQYRHGSEGPPPYHLVRRLTLCHAL